MKKSKSVISIVLGCTMIAGLLAGCGSIRSSSNTAGSSSGDTAQATTSDVSTDTASDTSENSDVTLEFWTVWTEGGTEEVEGTKMLQKFEEDTGITVNQTNFTYDMLHEKILTAAAAGNVPDIIFGLPEYIGEFYNMGIIEDLTDRYATWEDADQLSDTIKNAASIDGKNVGVPYKSTVRAFVAHDDDFEEAGVKIPQTWEDLMALSDFKDKTGKYPYEAACTDVRAAQELLVYFGQYGLQLCTEQSDGLYKCTWKDNPDELAKAAKVFQFYKDLVDNGIIDPNCKNWGWEETDENLATDIAAGYQTGNWLAAREESNPDTMDDISIYQIPYPSDGQPATYLECKSTFIMSASEHKDEAFKLATALCSKEWQQAAYESTSPRSDVSSDSKWSKDFKALSDTGVSFPSVTLSGINQAEIDAIAKVLQEGDDPQDVAEWLCDAINSSLEENGELSAS